MKLSILETFNNLMIINKRISILETLENQARMKLSILETFNNLMITIKRISILETLENQERMKLSILETFNNLMITIKRISILETLENQERSQERSKNLSLKKNHTKKRSTQSPILEKETKKTKKKITRL